jgi:hypothetical protein
MATGITRGLSWFLFATILGAPAARATYEPFPLPDRSRRWSVTLSTSFGYDDNYNTAVAGGNDSYIYYLTPELFVNVPLEQTFLGLRYLYGLTYSSVLGNLDQAHSVDLLFSHTFTPRLSLDMRNEFRRGIEPELVTLVSGVPLVTRRRGDYIYDRVTGSLSYMLTPRWSVTLEGNGELWRYDEGTFSSANDRNSYGGTVSLSRMLKPTTSMGANYAYGKSEYVGTSTNSVRDSQSHSLYASMSHRFSPRLSLQVSAGATLAQFEDGSRSTSPYFSSALSFSYAGDGWITAGASYLFSTTEVTDFRSMDTALVFCRASHGLTERLRLTAEAGYAIASFENPVSQFFPLSSVREERTMRFGLGLRYEFRRWMSFSMSYWHDDVTSDVLDRSFDRNRLSMGLRFTY